MLELVYAGIFVYQGVEEGALTPLVVKHETSLQSTLIPPP